MITSQEILAARILVVDDQAPNIELITQLLEGAGYTQVSSTMDPTVVEALHHDNPYDLILLDLQMPKMDGFQVLAALQPGSKGGYLPVIALTAQPAHKVRALKSGAKDFISKPFDLVEVATRIHNMLEVRLLYKKLESANQVLEDTVRERTAQLRESEARFKYLTELAADWYWEQDERGAFTVVSGPVLEMLGLQAQSMTAEPAFGEGDLSTGWNEEERALLKAKIADHEQFLDFSIRRTRHDGSTQRFRVSGEPIFNRSSLLIGYRGIGVEAHV